VLGLDGIDPQVVDLLMAEGKLPNFAKLRLEGAYARFISSKPLLSPVIWTTIATGKTPLEHGVGHFVAINEKTGEQLPVTSQMRRVKAVWKVLSEAGRSVAVVGWWATWPAETVQGTIVSDHTCYHFLFTDGVTGGPDSVGVTYPPEVQDEIAPMIRRPGDVTLEEASRFVKVSADEFSRPFDFNDDLSHFKWALATAESYRRIGLHLWEHKRPDLLMVYIEGVDSTSHLFGHLFRAKGLSGELAEQQERFGSAVEEMYRYADGIVGDFIEAIDDRTTLVVLSDHGFELGALQDDPSKTRDMRRVSERYHRIQGILYLYGNRVRAKRRIDRPTLVDVVPTVLALSGVAPARDMPGRVLVEALNLPEEHASERRPVASYETGERASAGDPGEALGSEMDPKILERLRALGYLGAQSPKGDRNLAALHFEAGRYAEAAQAYEQLVQQEPEDATLRASLAGALGALDRLDESLEQLNRAIELDPLNPEAYHNRGVIYERRGDREAAIKEYETALRYNPQYEPSRRSLVRLTGSAGVEEPQTAAERLAAALAERARQAAVRGDYAAAMEELDEAHRVAPRFARVYQYRSNVAFLMGDREGAIAALRKALELEPDNALFRTNLERLEKAMSSRSTRP
jgi:predicted AlkP superfamily phosphohydrolase/phosphomutase/Flp pilus assembly protein TadD